MKKFLALLAVLAVGVAAWSSIALAGNGNGITATPASTQGFNGSYSATFVRSASGIINETNRVNSAGPQNGWTSSDVWLQFRPMPGTPANPTCDPTGLVTAPFTYVNDQPSIAGNATSGYFLPGVSYNVCVYLVNPGVASGTVDSQNPDGSSVSLPLAGHYRIDVSGAWTNSSYGPVDAEYTSTDNWTTHEDGFDVLGWNLGPNFGDLRVGGQFVDWGTYNPSHAYSYTAALPAGSLNLGVFDGQNGQLEPSWYGDNSGSLNYTITYLGQ
jgi:hypothetical protein